MKVILILLLALTTVGQYPRPRAIAKFCVNRVVEIKAIRKAQEFNTAMGCRSLVVTPINQDFVHVYGIEVYIGE